MAVTIATEIAGQEATSLFTYSYIFEPLRIRVSESTNTATKIFVDLELIDLGSDTIINTLVKYAEFDLSPSFNINFDLMELAKQQRDSNTYKNANVDDIVGTLGKWSVVGRYKLNFKIYSDVNATPVLVKKILIIGGREFSQFTPLVESTTPINEFEYYGLDISEYENRWDNVWMPRVTLKELPISNSNPTVTKITGGGIANIDLVTINANTDEGGIIGVTLNGQHIVSHTFLSGVTIANLAIALRDAINAASIPYVATSNPNSVTITATTKGLVVPTTLQQTASNYIGDVAPVLTVSTLGVGTEGKPCGEAFLIWKSRFGGWMWWGFDMKKKDINHSYSGNLEVGMFEATDTIGGDPYIPVNYTEIKTMHSITLKSLALTKLELQAMAGIKSAAVIYYLEPGSEKLELMKLTGADTPWTTLARGGDFSVSLRGISETKQSTI